MTDRSKNIDILLDPKRPLSTVGFMNTMAEVIKVLHHDKSVGTITFKIVRGKNKDVIASYPIKLI